MTAPSARRHEEEEPTLDPQIRAVLSLIHDPCSVAAGRPLSLLDMGLVLGWSLSADGVLTLDLCVTFAGCTMAPHFAHAAARDLAALPGVTRVDTCVDPAFAWTRNRMRAPPPPMRGEPQAWRSRARATAADRTGGLLADSAARGATHGDIGAP